MLTIYTGRDVRQGEELTFAYFGNGADEDNEGEVKVDEHGKEKIKVVCSSYELMLHLADCLTLCDSLEALLLIKIKQFTDHAYVELQIVVGRCFNTPFDESLLGNCFLSSVLYPICYLSKTVPSLFICTRALFIDRSIGRH